MDEHELMRRAVRVGDGARRVSPPNPWVGCVLVGGGLGDDVVEGATERPGGRHAERVAIDVARQRHGPDGTRGATAYVTLEPCNHHGRTPPCSDALVEAGVARVVVGVQDPDPKVAGTGMARLREAGIEVQAGLAEPEVEASLAPYLTHRRTGRPYVVLKLASTLDGRVAAPDGTSRWITGPEARADAHHLRADSDAVLVGAGTVRADDPELTVRAVALADEDQPLRVVLGRAPEGARVHPCLELEGDLGEVLDTLGQKDVLQVLVEGGPTVAGAFHRAGLVDRYVVYLAPALFGGDDGRPLLAGPGAPTIDDLWRGHITSVTPLGADLRIDLSPIDREDAP